MKTCLSGLLPYPANTTIDYKNNRIKFKYNHYFDSNWDIIKNIYTEWFVLSLFFEVFLFILIFIFDFLINQTPSIITTTTEETFLIGLQNIFEMVYNLFIILIPNIIFATVITILHLYTPLGNKLKEIIPRSYDFLNKTNKSNKTFSNIKSNKIVFPIFDSFIFKWKASEDYEKHLEKVELVEEAFYEGKQEVGFYYIIFIFKEIPKNGELYVEWW